MGLEETLHAEERNEGHGAQLRRTRAAYQSKSCDDRAIFEYGWVLTRTVQYSTPADASDVSDA